MAGKTSLPKAAAKRLEPFIQRGIDKGMWSDDSTVASIYENKSTDASLKATIDDLGGPKSDIAIQFITDAVLVDLTDILRKTPFSCTLEIWEVSHTIIPSTGRPACFISGAAILTSEQGELDAAMFNMSLWDSDAALGDDLERDGVYTTSVTCKDVERDVLLIEPIAGLTNFKQSKGSFPNRADLLKQTFDVSQIVDLKDNLSRGMFDFRLIEGTLVYSGTQPTKAGGQFGRIMLRDDSSIDADDGEELILTGLTSPEIALRFGKYSKILALMTVSESAKYGLNANVKIAEALILVAPPKATQSASKDDDGDDASDYFNQGSDEIKEVNLDDDEDDDEVDEVEHVEEVVEEAVEEAGEPADSHLAEADGDDDDDEDDDWIDEDDDDWSDDDEESEESEESEPSQPTMSIAQAKKMSVADLRAFCREHGIKVDDLGHARKAEILDALDDAGVLE
jgi:hypothetical protein